MAVSIAVAFAAATASAAEGFVTLSYPLAVNVEGETIPTAIHMKLDIKRYDTSFDSFATGQLDAREKRFAEWVKTVRVRDYAKAGSMFVAPQPVLPPVDKSAESMRTVATNRTPRTVVDMYHSAFGGLRDITVVAQIRAGSKSLFVWEARGAESKLRRAFSIDDKLLVSQVTMSTPVELLIVNNVMGQAARDPNADRGRPGYKAPFEYAFPLDGPWTAGPHPVVLQFSGKQVDFPIDGDPAVAEAVVADAAMPDPVVALYRNTQRDLRQGNIEKYLEHFTEKSGAKWQRWQQSLTQEAFEQFQTKASAPRAIKFVLDASPLLIVFHGNVGNWTAGSLRYDYVVKAPGTGELKFANVAYSGFFDDVLGSPTLFDQNVLRQQTVAEAQAR